MKHTGKTPVRHGLDCLEYEVDTETIGLPLAERSPTSGVTCTGQTHFRFYVYTLLCSISLIETYFQLGLEE